MKKGKIILMATLAAVLASCGSKSGGKPNFADNEYGSSPSLNSILNSH